MIDKIIQLKKEKRAIILAHYYTRPEVQEVADFVGDSLALARQAAQTDADLILFAGVHFMAETAKILNPDKRVLIPDMGAGCSLADSCEAEAFAHFLSHYPNHTVLCYINCSAHVKALSDIIVTSGNALKVVESLPQDTPIVFAPDRNLGAFINQRLGRQMVLWDGACHVHDQITATDLRAMKEQYPDALAIAHPECRDEVLQEAHFVGSTAAMLNYVKTSPASSFIVVTESGILYELQRQNPDKLFYPLLNDQPETFEKGSCTDCRNCKYMKYNTLDNIYQALVTEQPEIVMDEALMRQARNSIERMLQF